jgi:tetratricopeptide (TPR) repeat protein
VKVKDDDPSYWIELGKINIQVGDRGGAYYAFSRANELDSGNVETLSTLTELALASGNLDGAEEHAKELDLVSPNHPSARIAYGYSYLSRQEFDKADEQADALLQSLPLDPNVKLLKARILFGRKEPEAAIKLLEDQVKAQPDDFSSWRALLMLYQRRDDWRAIQRVAARLQQLRPKDREWGLAFVEAALRGNDIAAARRASELLLGHDAPNKLVAAVLELWAHYWKSPEAIAEARRLASTAGLEQRLAYATYFNDVGKPDDSIALVGDTPRLPLNISNYSINSVIATALALKGRRAQAKQLFDGILAREPDHLYALRGRINLEIRMGDGKAAVVDAQRLVSVSERSGSDRLLLARAYAAAGDSRQADRTLWDAFHEIQADPETYQALRAHVVKTQGPDAARPVDDEYKEQRDTALQREFL